MNNKLSVFSFIKNEELTLEHALSSIRDYADELIVIDTGSTDNSVSIAKKYADKVVYWKWRNDFGAASNYGHSLCTNRFAMKWDGDWFLRSGQQKLLQLKQVGFEPGNKYHFSWIGEYDTTTLKPDIINMRDFIYDRNHYLWVSPIHTHLETDPNQTSTTIKIPEIVIYHYKDRLKKNYRYKQTALLIEGQLEKVSLEQKIKLLRYGICNFMFLEKYDYVKKYFDQIFTYPITEELDQYWITEYYALYLLRTKQFIELKQWIKNHQYMHSPQLELLKADLATIENKPAKARILYKNFITQNPYRGDEINVNFKRMIDHPKNMLKKLSV